MLPEVYPSGNQFSEVGRVFPLECPDMDWLLIRINSTNCLYVDHQQVLRSYSVDV